VLVTDGAPMECDADVGAVAAIAAEGAGGTPSVRTFVVGVGLGLA
jgi:hypothetical protein